MKLSIPYTKKEIMLASTNLGNKITYEIKAKVDNYFNNLPDIENKKKLNEIIAEYNGITTLELINSPNYTILIDEYKKSIYTNLIALLKENGFTDVEAYAFLAACHKTN